MAKRKDRNLRYLKIDLPENVKFIIRTLNEHGYEAYAVGGCVRDSLLGRTPDDWDITTSALPEEIKACFRRTVDTGIQHGTVTVMLGNEGYEVTTYRIDCEYEDGRHPSSVVFTDAVSEDLRRRDFTINAMAYNDDHNIVDLFEGRQDLEKRIIRCVGVPNDRFDEDALRILRAVRFAAQLDFDIDSSTRDAISDHAPRLKAVSKERILTEISKLICSAHIERTADIFQLGIVPYIAKNFREINIAQLMSLKSAAVKAAAGFAKMEQEELSEDAGLNKNVLNPFDLCAESDMEHRYIRFAFLTEGMPAEKVDEMLKDLKADNNTRKNAARLAEWVLKPLPAVKSELKSIMSEMSPDIFTDLLNLKLVSSQTMLYEKLCEKEDIRAVIDIFSEIAEKEEPVYLNDLALTGADLISHGMKPGPELGKLLKDMLAHVWNEPEHNDADYLRKHFHLD